jgi:hypothetical protein
MKRKVTEEEEAFANHILNRKVAHKIHKQLSKFNSQQPNNSIRK